MSQISLPPQNYSPVFPVEVKKELRVYEIKKRTGRPFFLASLFIPEMLWTTRIYNLDMILDKFVTMEAGNTTRVFLFSSCWHPEYCKWAGNIFPQNKSGKFFLPEPDDADKLIGQGRYINPWWVDQVIERIKKVTRRKIMLIVSLWDHCGFHYRKNCSWDMNFLNPDNNTINTSNDNCAYYKYASDASKEMQNTGKIVEAMTRYMLLRIHESLTVEERKYIAIETCNEGYSDTAWHLRMKEIIDDTWGTDCPRWRRFTSTEGATSKATEESFILVTHQIGDMKSYGSKMWYEDPPCGISTDGWRVQGEYAPVPIPLATAKALLKQLYADGHVLFELLNGHRQNHIRLPEATHNTTPDKHWYDFGAMRWSEMRKLAKLLIRLTK